MNELQGLRILLGITGGIAAYKGAELTRLLRQNGCQVQVVMTKAATAFITPLTLQALSGQPVRVELLDADEESAMSHIDLARQHDLILIAPATAQFLAKLRTGWADDLLSALCLAAEVPILVAPAMNQAMWRNPATQENLSVLAARGIRILGPAEGQQACGETGPGRLLEPPAIVRLLAESTTQTGALAGHSVLITAGPTREPIDPVRYIGNRSSGKMGYALAVAAHRAGARVTLISGPTDLPPPHGIHVVAVETAREMYEAVLACVGHCHIYIGAAAVADYTPGQVACQKIKKNHPELTLALQRTPDILATVAALNPPPYTVGFAAETEQMEHHARHKRLAKSLDMVAGNWVGRSEGGFGANDNALYVCWQNGEHHLPLTSKPQLAQQLINLIAEQYHAKHSSQNS